METKGNVGKASKEVTQHRKSRNISSEEEEDETSLLKKISMEETDAEILNPLVKSGPFNEKERGTEPRIKYPPTKKVKFSLATVDDSSSKETDNQSAEHEPILTSPCQQQTVLSTQQPAKTVPKPSERLKRLPPKTIEHPVDKVALINDLIFRIINWKYDWIEVTIYIFVLKIRFN
jgi:hypothetical protein